MKSELVKGDSLQELKKYDDNSVDLLCTDPPYGYGFMGRDWDKVLPGKVLRVNNEDVIDDLEGQVWRILQFIDIPFEESCVSFHKTERSVRTASSEQVRQPINKKGMGRWKPYAKHLKPLLETIDNNLLNQEDIDLINS